MRSAIQIRLDGELDRFRRDRSETEEKLSAVSAQPNGENRSAAMERLTRKLETLDASIETHESKLAEIVSEARAERDRAYEEAQRGLPVSPTEPATGRVRVGGEPLTYEKHGQHSFFRDAYHAQRGDFKAAERIQRHMQEMDVERESRALSSTDSAGGYLVAPIWLNEEFVELLRAGRPVANSISPEPLPPDTDSINLPRESTGATVATQSSDNVTLSNTDPVFDTIAADVKTVGGYVDLSRQLVDRGVSAADRVIFDDLTRAYNTLFETQVINSATANNLGLNQVASTNAITYTQATPTTATLYPKIGDAARQIAEQVFAPADAIYMAPRRWGAIMASLDTQNRPLAVPAPQGPNNAVATVGAPTAEGAVGSIMGINVYISMSIPQTLGAGTNQDVIFVVRRDQLLIWEDPAGPYLDRFDDVLSASLGVRLRLFNYWAQCLARRPKAISVISGTGLVPPTW